ncbi:tetratricopeptide repeat-containing sensor histidine kinase [Halpernia sp.]|uniref:tetratricopeptide repeat-containing sensor histidine kinase n=1 Tax=Halpernia sp. TaxID=2782209 RepID=UPI003A95168D
MVKKNLLSILFIVLCLFTIKAQISKKETDSLNKLFENKTNAQKLILLKTAFKIGKPKTVDLSYYLSKMGYKLALQKNDLQNSAFFAEYLAISFHKKSQMDSAMFYHLSALETYQKLGDKKSEANIYNEIAKLNRKLQNNERALKYYEKALDLFNELNDLEGKATILNESGVVYEQMNQNTEALKRYESSLEIQRKRKDSVGIGYSLEFIGYNHMLQKNFKKSEDYLQQALEIREKLKDDFALCLNYFAMGELYSKMGKVAESNKYIKKTFELSDKLKYPGIKKEAFEILIANEVKQNNYKKAYELQNRLRKFNDSLFTVEKEKNVEQLTQKYETVEKENQILAQKDMLNTRKLWLILVVAITIITALLGLLFYFKQRNKIRSQRKENELHLALSEIKTQNKLKEQRLSISRDLHDNIGSQLTFIISSVDTIKHFIGTENTKITEKLSKISSFTKETISELRDTVWAMNKPEISTEDLANRLSDYISKANESLDRIKFNLNVNNAADKNYDSKTGMFIYRMVQEAVNNAIKHSKANEISVKIEAEKSENNFLISDNGKGFNTENLESHNLRSMRSRAQELGIHFEVKSDKNGTKISFKI